MKYEIELPGGEEVELIAKAIYAHRNYSPPRPLNQIEWPPMRRQTLVQTWNLAKAIHKAQQDAKREEGKL